MGFLLRSRFTEYRLKTQNNMATLRTAASVFGLKARNNEPFESRK